MKQVFNFSIWLVAIPIWSLIFLFEMYLKLIFDRDLKWHLEFGKQIERILL